MLEVDIDKILPLTEARDNFNKIIDDVGGTEHMYVLTKNGKPSAVVVGVNHLEKLTGKSADELTSMVEKKADQTPVVEEVNPPASGSKPPAPEPMATGQSIQPGPGPATPPPLEVPPETSASIPTNVGASPPASGESPPPAPDGGQAVPTSSPGSVPAPSSIEGAKPEVASNQAPAPPNPPAGGAAASDSDLFV